MKKYDCIVVGAGNGGLVASIMLQKQGYKVLVLEQQNNVGGICSPIRKGRFSFEPSFQSLYIDSEETNNISINKIFEELEIEKPEFVSVNNEIQICTTSDDESIQTFIVHGGIDNYVKEVEKMVPGSSDSLNKFFELAEECDEALNYINDNANVDYSLIEKKYTNFYDIGNSTVSKILDQIEMPLEAQEIINSLWIYLGSPEGDLSFSHYASFIYNFINYGIKVPKLGNYDISLSLYNKFLELGGEIRFNHQVVRIITEDGSVKGVRTLEGKIYYADYVIADLNQDTVYRKLIDNSELPPIVNKGLSKRELGGRPFSIYLGLNRSAKYLGIDKSTYLIYETLDTDLEFNHMTGDHQNMIVNCLSNMNSEVSAKGTCELVLNAIYFDDCFGNYINVDNYVKSLNDMASKLIETFEETLGIHIKEFIEEIELRTPYDISMKLDAPEGTIYGYRYTGLDNLLPRMLSRKNEKYVDKLYFCGGFNGDVYGIESTYVVAYKTALSIIKRNRGFKNGK